MKPPPRTLKRKRTFEQVVDYQCKVAEGPKVDSRKSPINAAWSGPTPPRDTVSDTLGLTSANEKATATLATGDYSRETKRTFENGHLSGWFHSANSDRYIEINSRYLAEQTRVQEAAKAYWSAKEILDETLARENNQRCYSKAHTGFLGTTNQPSGLDAAALPRVVNDIYATPYARSQPTTYVTPYANPSILAEVSDPRQGNEGQAEETRGARSQASGTIGSISHGVHKANEIAIDIDKDCSEPKDKSKGKEASPMSVGMLDGFLALANGGVLPGKDDEPNGSTFPVVNKDQEQTTLFAPPSPGDTIDEAISRFDDDIQALVDRIADELARSQEPIPFGTPVGPPKTPWMLMKAKQLAAELKRQIEIAQPEVNTIMPEEQMYCAQKFYTCLLSCIHTRNDVIIKSMYSHAQRPPVAANQWVPGAFPPQPPNGYMVSPTQQPGIFAPLPPLGSGPPILQNQFPGQASIPRSNFITPPVVKNSVVKPGITVSGNPAVAISQPGNSKMKRKRKE